MTTTKEARYVLPDSSLAAKAGKITRNKSSALSRIKIAHSITLILLFCLHALGELLIKTPVDGIEYAFYNYLTCLHDGGILHKQTSLVSTENRTLTFVMVVHKSISVNLNGGENLRNQQVSQPPSMSLRARWWIPSSRWWRPCSMVPLPPRVRSSSPPMRPSSPLPVRTIKR